MSTTKLRIVFVALAAATIASTTSPALAADEFRFSFFPHKDLATHFADDFGNSRPGGRHHQGNDVFATKGTPIVAIADGVVTTIGHSARSGYYVRIEHRDGWESWYMHLNNDTAGTDDGRGGFETAIAEGLEEGMFVEAGSVIGYVGDSGNAEGASPHTHFELHRDGHIVNPYPYLKDAFSRWERIHDLTRNLL
jgi:murein DD-endopeptidase MepM/ murein hydrolase activator NlpD